MKDNVSDQLSDLATTYQFDILRVEAGMRKDVLRSLKKLEKDLLSKILNGPDLSKSKKEQIKKVLRSTSATIKDVYDQIGRKNIKQLEKLAVATTAKTTKDLSGVLGVNMGAMQLSASQISNIVKGPVMQGNPVKAWWESQADKTTRRFNGEIQQGMFLGEGMDEMSRRIKGTPVNNYKDGISQLTKRESEAIVRTAVQSIANTAKLETFNNASSDVVKGIEWVSTLDLVTTATCRSLDGLKWDLPDYKPRGHDKVFPGAIAHWGCRSSQIAATASWSDLAGKKIPEVTRDATFEAAFQENLKKLGMSQEQRDVAVSNQRASMDGGASASLDFDKWARKKGDPFVKDLIGPKRFELWKKNDLTMRDLTDQKGRELTIKELEESIATGKPTPETEGRVTAQAATTDQLNDKFKDREKELETALKKANRELKESKEKAQSDKVIAVAIQKEKSDKANKEKKLAESESASIKAELAAREKEIEILKSESLKSAEITNFEKTERLKNRPDMVSLGDGKELKKDTDIQTQKPDQTFKIGRNSLLSFTPEQASETLSGVHSQKTWVDEQGPEVFAEMDSQQEILSAWAKEKGIFFSDDDLKNLQNTATDTDAGGEHDVLFVKDEEGKRWAIRFTKDEQFGRSFKTPKQYLDRWTDSNVVNPAAQVTLVGYAENERKNGIIITAQPFIEGREPSEKQLASGLGSKGWEPLREVGTGGLAWHHPETGYKMYDVKTDNVIITDNNELVFIDVWVIPPKEK